MRGEAFPDSGYRHDVSHRLTPVDPTHPVVRGLEEGFEITDEVYLCPVFENDVEPLLRSDFVFLAKNFHSAAEALRGRMHSSQGWSHPPGSNLAAWTHTVGRSTVVTIVCGDGPPAFANPALRRLLGNAIRFVSGSA